MSTNDDNTLGFTLELYSRYMDAAKVCEICIGKLGSYWVREGETSHSVQL